MRVPGALEGFNLSSDDANAIIMKARVKIGWIEEAGRKKKSPKKTRRRGADRSLMTAVAHKMDEDGSDDARERRDIVSGEVMPDSRLIRFVADPDGQVVPDVAAKLPGRGLWVDGVAQGRHRKAVEKKLFARAAKANVTAAADLAERAEKALVTRMLGDLGIARRSGALVLGFDNVLRALDRPKPPKRADRGA